MFFEDDDAFKLKQVLMVEAHKLATMRYSYLRSNHQKWLFSRQEGKQENSVEILGDNVQIFIAVQTGNYIDTYSVKSLMQRVNLKRNIDYFSTVFSLWELINPFHIKGVAKLTWLKLNEFLYKSISNFPDVKQALQLALEDTQADFKDSSALIFIDFYDSLFEYVDSFCKSKLASEYVRLIKRIYEDLHNSRSLNSISLHTKHHLKDNFQPSYASWMLPFLKELKKPKNMVRQEEKDGLSFLRRPNTSISKRFQERIKSSQVKRVRSGRQFINIQLEKIESGPIEKFTRSVVHTPMFMATKSLQRRSRTARVSHKPDHLEIVGPLSRYRREARKEIGLLEEVIEVRKKHVRDYSSPEEMGFELFQ